VYLSFAAEIEYTLSEITPPCRFSALGQELDVLKLGDELRDVVVGKAVEEPEGQALLSLFASMWGSARASMTATSCSENVASIARPAQEPFHRSAPRLGSSCQLVCGRRGTR